MSRIVLVTHMVDSSLERPLLNLRQAKQSLVLSKEIQFVFNKGESRADNLNATH